MGRGRASGPEADTYGAEHAVCGWGADCEIGIEVGIAMKMRTTLNIDDDLLEVVAGEPGAPVDGGPTPSLRREGDGRATL